MIIIYDELSDEQELSDRHASALDKKLQDRYLTLHLMDATGWSLHQLMEHLRPALDHDEVQIRVKNALSVPMEPFQSRHLDRWLLSKSAAVISGDTRATGLKTELPVWTTSYFELEPYNHGPGGGMWAEGVTLLVGERANYKGPHFFLVPFASMTRAGCSAWLTEQLIMHGVMERQLYWINAQRIDGTWTDHQFIQSLKPSKIIALGGIAERWCLANHIEHQSVTHPQFHRRFKSKEPYPLMDLLW